MGLFPNLTPLVKFRMKPQALNCGPFIKKHTIIKEWQSHVAMFTQMLEAQSDYILTVKMTENSTEPDQPHY